MNTNTNNPKRCMADWLAANGYFLACWQGTVPCVTQQVATCVLLWTLLWTVANALACLRTWCLHACTQRELASKVGGYTYRRSDPGPGLKGRGLAKCSSTGTHARGYLTAMSQSSPHSR